MDTSADADRAPFSARPEWSDVQPWYPEGSGHGPVVEVPYTDEWRETHAYLHAFLRSGERSPRAMEVATAAIEQNAADYSAWALRWACAQAAVALAATDKRSGPLLDELRYTEELAESMPKNYQLWNHRRLACAMLAHLVEAPVRAALSQREDAFTAAVLEDDAKNYHAWAHRVWMTDFFKMHAHELAFTAAHIELDDRNNSAWNARFTALDRLHGAESTPAGVAWPDEVVASEMSLVRTCIERDTANESAWAYAKAVALVARTQDALNDIAGAMLQRHPGCSHAACVLADAAEEKAAAAADMGDVAAAASSVRKARELFQMCATHDPIRQAYWMFRMRTAGCME